MRSDFEFAGRPSSLPRELARSGQEYEEIDVQGWLQVPAGGAGNWQGVRMALDYANGVPIETRWRMNWITPFGATQTDTYFGGIGIRGNAYPTGQLVDTTLTGGGLRPHLVDRSRIEGHDRDGGVSSYLLARTVRTTGLITGLTPPMFQIGKLFELSARQYPIGWIFGTRRYDQIPNNAAIYSNAEFLVLSGTQNQTWTLVYGATIFVPAVKR